MWSEAGQRAVAVLAMTVLEITLLASPREVAATAPRPNPVVVADVVSPVPTHPSQEVMGGVLFFAGWVAGRQGLWRVDAPGAAPDLVWGGETDPVDGTYASLRRTHRGRVYFTYAGRTWVSDGTRAGTAPLVDVAAASVEPVGPEVLVVPEDPRRPTYRSDGTAAGTVVHGARVDERVYAGGRIRLEAVTSCSSGRSTYLVADNGVRTETLLVGGCWSVLEPGPRLAHRTWFGWSPDGAPPTLWSTDGTTAGTRQLRSARDRPVVTLGAPVAADGVLYVRSGRRVWVTDGTAAGTLRVPGVHLVPSRASQIVPYRGGVLALPGRGDGFRIADRGRAVTCFPMPSRPAMLADAVAWRGLLVGEHREDVGVLGAERSVLYLWAPTRPRTRVACQP